MQFAIFGSAQADSERPGAALGDGFHEFVEFNVEAEALGYDATFLVEHHFTGWNQVSATLQLLTWLAARTTTAEREGGNGRPAGNPDRPAAAADRAGMTAFRGIASLRPARLLSCVVRRQRRCRPWSRCRVSATP
jgi:hypothetical protein